MQHERVTWEVGLVATARVAAPASEGGRGDREVHVPATELAGCSTWEDVAELVFAYGQNDVLPVARRASVSVGDDLRFDWKGTRFLVAVEAVGFQLLGLSRAE